MAAALYDIDTLANVKVYLGVGAADTTRDTLLQTLITNISLAMENYTGRKIKLQDISSEIHDGNGRYKLRPRWTPLYAIGVAGANTATQLASIQFRDDVDDTTWADAEDDTNHQYVHSPALHEESPQNTHCIELYEVTFPAGARNVKIHYQAGYTPIPGDLMMVFYEMVQRAYDESKQGNNQLGKSSFNDNRSNINIVLKDMKPEWQAVLDRYKVRYQ